MSNDGGKKFDAGKVRLELLPSRALREVARVLTFGAKKYGDWNWAKGMKWSRLYGATQRHLTAWVDGEDNDPETGISHLAHAACSMLFLLVYQARGLGTDDRHKFEPLDVDKPIPYSVTNAVSRLPSDQYTPAPMISRPDKPTPPASDAPVCAWCKRPLPPKPYWPFANDRSQVFCTFSHYEAAANGIMSAAERRG